MIFIFNKINQNRLVKKLNKEYPSLTLESALFGKISIINQGDPKVFRNDPNGADLIINDSIKIRINTSSELRTKNYFDNLVKIGDIISKKPGTDIISIYHFIDCDTFKYEFMIQDDQHYPLK